MHSHRYGANTGDMPLVVIAIKSLKPHIDTNVKPWVDTCDTDYDKSLMLIRLLDMLVRWLCSP